MNKRSGEYGWIGTVNSRTTHIAEEYGWTQPLNNEFHEITCCECGRSFSAPESAGVCYCERCVNLSCD